MSPVSRQGSRGQSLVEYALVVPIFLLIVLAIIEFGVVISAYNACANAAREGARVAVVGGDWDTAARSLTGVLQNVNVVRTVSGERVTVRVTGEAYLALFGGHPTIPLSAASTMYRE